MQDSPTYYTKYDSAEWTAGVVTDYNVVAQTLFVNVKNPRRVSIRSDQAVSVRFDSVSNPAFTVGANTAFDMPMSCYKIFLTTSGSTGMKIMLFGND